MSRTLTTMVAIAALVAALVAAWPTSPSRSPTGVMTVTGSGGVTQARVR